MNVFYAKIFWIYLNGLSKIRSKFFVLTLENFYTSWKSFSNSNSKSEKSKKIRSDWTDMNRHNRQSVWNFHSVGSMSVHPVVLVHSFFFFLNGTNRLMSLIFGFLCMQKYRCPKNEINLIINKWKWSSGIHWLKCKNQIKLKEIWDVMVSIKIIIMVLK